MKKLLTVLLVLAMVMGLTACGKKNQHEAVDHGEATIWYTYTQGQETYLLKAVEDFNASQDKFKITATSQSNQGFADSVYQAVMAKNGPDIIIDYASTAATYVEDNKVIALDEYLSEDLQKALSAGAKEEATSFEDGKMHVFPIVFSGPVLFYNPELLEAAGVAVPTNWDEVYEASKVINQLFVWTTTENDKVVYHVAKEDPGVAGTKHPWGFAVDSPTDVLQSMIMQNGVEIWDNNAKECKFADPKVYAALDWYGKGCQEGLFLSNPTLDNYFSSDYNAYNIAMYVGSVAGSPYLSAPWDVAPMPQTKGDKEWTPAWNRGVMIFNYDDEARAQAAAAFLEYFAKPEVNAGWCEACNYMTALTTTQDNATYKAFLGNGTDAVKALLALRPESAGSFIAVPAIQYVRNALKNAMADAAAGVSGEQAVKNAIEYVNDQL